ncbi:MAG TPA: M28 family peptidase [Candidatus Saccharimonadales bacterium]|nr:M28 family peptidase [Candidatus Saccharimonadales bacterium]
MSETLAMHVVYFPEIQLGYALRTSRFVFALGLIGFFTGCINVPPVPNRSSKVSEDLFSHVSFLSQPQLKGRKPGTRGSRAARQYIEARYKAYGLVPWEGARGYELSFNYGKNVVGVLPGSDPELAKEVIIVSAHYDHLGKDAKGRVCPGAADNAAGVAALLKVAEQLSALGERPKRTVAFVAFDCEEWMLFGSFAFSSQPNVQSAKIAAVLNMDMLGRDLMDVVRNTLFIAGAEFYPQIREQVSELGKTRGMRVLPLGTDLVGPRSDHVAFQSLPVPCLFLSSGTYRDYHQPTDTAEKLNRTNLESSAAIVFGLTRELANGKTAQRASPSYDDELRSIIAVMAEVNANLEQAGIRKEDAEAFIILSKRAQACSKTGNYVGKTRDELIAEASGVLAPYFLPIDTMAGDMDPQQRNAMRMAMLCLQQFYTKHGTEMLDGYRTFVRQMLKYRPNLLRGMPAFRYEAYELTDDDISLAKATGDRLTLNTIVTRLTLSAESRTSPWLLKSFGFSMSLNYDGSDCEGTREQLRDFCLLRLKRAGTNAQEIAGTRRVLARVIGAVPDGAYTELLQDRLRDGGFKDEPAWIASCVKSESPELALAAIASKVNHHQIRSAALDLVTDRSARGDVRAAAIRLLGKSREKIALLAFCDVLDDATPLEKREYDAMFRADYPFAERLVVKTLKPLKEKQMKPNLKKTIGDLVYQQLKKASAKDFGKDAHRWKEWARR